MSPPHLFAASVAGEHVVIEGDDAHHAVRVLRLSAGERVTVSDGAGTVAAGVVVEAGRRLTVEVTSRRTVSREPPRLVVVQGIPKAGKFEQIVQKLTELGVDEIVPLRAHRSVARWDTGAKLERLRAIGREAAKQSRRAWLPTIADPVDLSGAPRASLALALHEEAALRLSGALPAELPTEVSVFIGPEGGFDPQEMALLAGIAVPVSLGPQILRTETAALVACALILGHYGRIG